ncbi:MAG: PH domain-containing protein [bacterium]|nr:PH domain-containing protein [bacterium]
MCVATLETPLCSGAAAEAPAQEAAAGTQAVSLPTELLDGGEVVVFALKPSLWFVLFDSIKWLVAGIVVLAGASLAGRPLEMVSYATLVEVTTFVVVCRVGVALLRWVSRFYVLTNRRVLRICGVFRANILDTTLTDIVNTRVTEGWHEQLTALGTIRFACAQFAEHDPTWHNLARPHEVHDQLRRAIERAIDRQHGG